DYIARPTAPATATAAVSAVSAETRRANFIQARRIFAAEVQVLREFAAAYTRGEPFTLMLLRASQHASTHTPTEQHHITVDVASEKGWEEGSGFARTGFHVYSVNGEMAKGYRAYTRKKSLGKKGHFRQGKAKEQIDEAKSRNLQQYLERMVEKYSDAKLRKCAPKIGRTEGSATQATWASVVRKD
ncbi:hypothetical protein E4U32_007792, partial [Claviceps aff. humidiphila group G2b]